ncbi:lysophospholipid acyltransferase family protein [Sulfurimonas marina]|uniref:1-acyl-sn-glycerol-3-phosphate acyltransferase n=1 Tax=Sulfurimonas marina TaxID=2590551 RepID=A0A7M1AXJ5_9BACT|nr:lysophospholipid acyltransferase family protein [Sulfurimonas marina]QOP41092.1 1-acyl-sn-glycerol-3-phosphate acyltransferase [Sulfurimonas marina]
MVKDLRKYAFMIRLGYRYIYIFKKIFFHPYISLKHAYEELSKARQAYSNKVLKRLNIEVEVDGELPKEDKILYAINHRSLLDIIVMEHIFSQHNKNGTWIAKQELFDSFYGKFFEYSGCISVDLETKRGLVSFFKTIKKTFSKVDNMNLYIFPEGERHKAAGIKEFQSGAEKIAKANNLKVVPVFINDELEKVFKASPYKEQYKVKVHIGDIVDHTNLEEKYISHYKQSLQKGNK